MTRAQRFGSRAVGLVVTLMLLLLAGLIWLNQKQSKIAPQAQLQEAVTAEVKRIGGKLSHGITAPANFFEPAPLPAIDRIDLINTSADGALLKQLCQLSTIQRLNLEGTKVEPGHFACLSNLTNVQFLSLARTQITDSDIAAIVKLPKLKTLSLRETSITDSGIKQLAGMPALLTLDVSSSKMTAGAVTALAALPMLTNLTLDESCVTSESVQQLKLMKRLESVEVRISSELGKEANQLLAGQLSGQVIGINQRGKRLWDAATPWRGNLAGVIEAVDAEIGLEPRVRAKLIELLNEVRFAGSHDIPRYRMPDEPIGDEIKSLDEFIAASRDTWQITKNIRQYERDRITKEDVPKLLEVLETCTTPRELYILLDVILSLIVRHGDDEPELIRELERLLNHKNPYIRSRSTHALAPSRENSFTPGQAWAPSEQMIEFGVPHLLRLCDDEDPMVRMSASDELGNLVTVHPQYASQAMTALVKAIRRGTLLSYGSNAISQVTKANPEAAKAAVPELRRMLENISAELPDEYLKPLVSVRRSIPRTRDEAEAIHRNVVLEALCLAARVDPILANEVAQDGLKTIRDHRINGVPPLALLVTRENRDAIHTLVHGLIDIEARGTLASVVGQIRDLPPEFAVQLDVVKQELDPKYCWFHPRVASVPGMGKDGKPLVLLTIQKHLEADDHYSGLYYMTSSDLGASWSEMKAPAELGWKQGENHETVAVCDVTPGWHAATKKVIAIGTMLRYSQAGAQLLDKPRSHEFAYAVYDPQADLWSPWKAFDMPIGNDSRFDQVAPGCVQWVVKSDGTLLVPVYYQGPNQEPYAATVVHATFDGTTLKYLEHGDELKLDEVRGLVEPSLAFFRGNYYLTLRNDKRAYVTASNDGLHFAPIQPWTFDDGTELGSYNTQQHWVVHRDGLFLVYTRRGSNNDHIPRHRAPLFMARVSVDRLRVIRKTEKELIPERGVMLGNFGAASIDENESWVTDSEFITGGKAHARGANGSTFVARITWNKPNSPSY